MAAIAPVIVMRRVLGASVVALMLALARPIAQDPATPHASVAHVGPFVKSTAHGYVTSAACQSCHSREHEAWYASYHRSMTEVPGAATVRAPWQGTLEWQ